MGADPKVVSEGRLGNTIHLVLANKRQKDLGRTSRLPEEYASIGRFISALRENGYDVNQAQADIERWEKLTKQHPTQPGWYREAEIWRLQKRDAELEKVKRREQERDH